eukprot:11649528-Heterocapsa_arctica.AAC.1
MNATLWRHRGEHRRDRNLHCERSEINKSIDQSRSGTTSRRGRRVHWSGTPQLQFRGGGLEQVQELVTLPAGDARQQLHPRALSLNAQTKLNAVLNNIMSMVSDGMKDGMRVKESKQKLPAEDARQATHSLQREWSKESNRLRRNRLSDGVQRLDSKLRFYTINLFKVLNLDVFSEVTPEP